MQRAFLGICAALAVIALLASCATTEVTARWKDENYQKQPAKVLVQALLKKPTNRRIMEDEFVAHFRYRGIEAVPGYTVFPGEELPRKEAIAEQLRAGGFDTLLLVRLVETKEETRVVPGTVTAHPAYAPAPRHGGWPGYYGSGYSAVYSPSYTVEDKYVIAETSLYDVATEKLIWAATSETWIAESDQKLLKTYVNVMMDSLRKNRLVP